MQQQFTKLSQQGISETVAAAPVCAQWLDASGRRTSFRAEIYEWQIAALLATAQVDESAKARIVGALGGEPPVVDIRRVSRLEQQLRTIALDNAFGRMTDEVYLRRKSELAGQIEAARRPESGTQAVDAKRALGYLDDLRSLWDAELPNHPSTTRCGASTSCDGRRPRLPVSTDSRPSGP